MEKLFPSVTRTYPSFRDSTVKNGHLWLAGRKKDDNAEGFWRIYDKLYDLSQFMNIHPGGRDWIKMTKGLDITELFETHHVSSEPAKLLEYYFVRDAMHPRNSMLTFAEDGFYKTLKRKVAVKDRKSQAWKSKLINDSLLLLTLLFVVITGVVQTKIMCFITAMFLTATVSSSHNFFHQRDNWRMKVFNLSLMSYRDWRISHVLSHHHFPNSLSDLEISYFEPYLLFSVYSAKSFLNRYGSWLYSLVVFGFIYFMQAANRIGYQISKGRYYLDEILIPLVIPAILWLVGAESPLKIWFWILAYSSIVFGFTTVTASAHHTSRAFHEGDTVKNYDFGAFALGAVDELDCLQENLLISMVHFGNHGLHHLFPTIDCSAYPSLQEVFKSTSKDFGIEIMETSWHDAVIGYFKTLARVRKNGKNID